MTDTKQCCGNCHWFKADSGDCDYPLPSAVIDSWLMSEAEGTTCPTFRQRGERLPQRFRYRLVSDGEWSYGVCMYVGGMWRIRTENGGHNSFVDGDDAARQVGMVIFSPHCIEWIDRDYGWEDVTA